MAPWVEIIKQGVLLDLLFMLRTLWKNTLMDNLLRIIYPQELKKIAVEISQYV